jgi:Mrp family chromosome partitioning ATPase
MDLSTMSEALLDQIEMLRVQLETMLPMPVFLAISSARDNDGKGLLASGLARSMHAASYSTLLVLADERTHDVERGLKPNSLREISDLGIARHLAPPSPASPDVMILPISEIKHAISRIDVARFAETCRSSYKVTIVEAAAMLTNSFAMFATLLADGVLLTVREGRRVCSEDRQLATTLAHNETSFLGVVAVAASMIPDSRSGTARTRTTPRKAAIASNTLETSRQEQAV